MAYPQPGQGAEWTVKKPESEPCNPCPMQCNAGCNMCTTNQMPKGMAMGYEPPTPYHVPMPKADPEIIAAVHQVLQGLCPFITDIDVNEETGCLTIERTVWDSTTCTWQKQCKDIVAEEEDPYFACGDGPPPADILVGTKFYVDEASMPPCLYWRLKNGDWFSPQYATGNS